MTTPRPLEVVKIPDGWIRNPNYVEAVVLVANTTQQVAIPATAAYATFSANTDFYVAYGSNPTAVVPVASTIDGSSNELNPLNRFFGLGEVAKMALISVAGGIVTITFWGA